MADVTRQSKPLFPIGVVQELTALSARQIRYYEEQGLIKPERTETKRRLYSFNDVDRLLSIKEYLDQGLNIAGIKMIFDNDLIKRERVAETVVKTRPELSDGELYKLLKNQLKEAGQPGKTSLIQGELGRFFK
ncbi:MULTISPECIES: MerR family transcriptional regulator [Exiguobacterium]|uniref:Transcriptional regulator (Nitrogen metabolism) n=1 Tax=Exiguobacterium oxidotolerans TaxID=223958 RepID=A0A653IEY6_9BACL|nr:MULTISPECIES: MerR family transcriptional regulator [Exiguobacterium]ASI35032.1 MerR family transcriptional regulator [Exiguobacterium sp. N4-1P]VWX37818.1 transcriptional regulator (nitrogen metabolism) [Exiguobacterium oxidotolerans]